MYLKKYGENINGFSDVFITKKWKNESHNCQSMIVIAKHKHKEEKVYAFKEVCIIYEVSPIVLWYSIFCIDWFLVDRIRVHILQFHCIYNVFK